MYILKNVKRGFCFLLLISMLWVPTTPVVAGTDGYWQLDKTLTDSKDFRDSAGRLNSVTEITHGGPEDGFDAVVELITTEPFGNGKYKAGLKWAHLPSILKPGVKTTLSLELAQIETNTKLMIGAAASMHHGIGTIPPQPGKPGGPLNISVQTFSKEGKEYNQKTLVYVPYPKQANVSDPYIIRIKFSSDSTKDFYHFDYVYRWNSSPDTASDEIKVILNGKPLDTDVPPIIISGRTMLPLRSILEALGATIDWNSSTRTVTATKDGTTVILVIDSNTASVNGKASTLDVPAQILSGRTIVPVRFLSETFGATVKWNGETRTITID